MSEDIKTNIAGLDEQMSGGIPSGHIVLLCGPAGSLKTTLAYHMLQASGHNSIYLTVEQSAQSLLRQMSAFGIGKGEKDNPVSIVDIGIVRKSLGHLGDKTLTQVARMFIADEVKNREAKLLVIDSLDSFYPILDFRSPRKDLFHFFGELKKLGLTVFLVSEMAEDQTHFGAHGCEAFLSDGIIHLTRERAGRTVARYIRIVKMRAVDHPHDYFPLLSEGDFKIVVR